MESEEILNYVFDYDMCQSINNFSQIISSLTADVFMVMSRKAACFITFLKRNGRISFDGQLITDRLLDFDTTWLNGKSVILIDDVIVSGTTLHSVIEKLNKAKVKCIKVYVLGVNEKYYNSTILDYLDCNQTTQNYLQPPFIPLSDAACMRTCSNIVSTFMLDLLPYDVDFPKHNFLSIPKFTYDQLVSCSDWFAYDVSSDLQAENGIRNVTLLPGERIIEQFNNEIGIPVSKLAFFKIRLFSQYTSKNSNRVIVNAVPYFLFNTIALEDVIQLFDYWFPNLTNSFMSNIAKVRILQFVLAEKLYKIWIKTLNSTITPRTLIKQELSKSDFLLVFPEFIYSAVLNAIDSGLNFGRPLFTLINPEQVCFEETKFESKIVARESQKDNIAVLQTKLVEPFTNLYFTKEKQSREIVLEYGKGAFERPEYQEIIDRLNHGYSYRTLIQLLEEYPDIYDKETTVSLFIDEAIDAGVIVPIIAEEKSSFGKTIYFRAYRHGEDVPFGELQEKLCAIMLASYAKSGGNKILTKLRVEKMLVLLVHIGLTQHIFRPSPQDTIYYKVNVDAYLQGNITTIQDTTSKRSRHYLRHRTDAVWLSDVLVDKGIIVLDEDKTIKGIVDNIDIDVDRATRGKVQAIGKAFAELYKNLDAKKLPAINDDDLILFSTCMFPRDILNALAAELAIFDNRWIRERGKIHKLVAKNSSQVIPEIVKSDMYEAINSGQSKFFHFMNKDAQRRINEITEQLENSENSFIGTAWEQFWPDNSNWSTKSIEPQLLNTILKEGKLLITLNLLCRLLFLCCLDTSETSLRKKYKEEIFEYQAKLETTYFKRWEDIGKTIYYSNEVLKIQSMSLKTKSIECFNIWKMINDCITYAGPLLSDVELLTDRHGKIFQINRYIHSLHLILPEELFADVGAFFENWFSAKKIEYQPFIIVEPTEIFPQQGIWFFIKSCYINDFNQLLNSAFSKFPRMKGAHIFYNLSEDLRLKMPVGVNTKHQFGKFSSYAYKAVGSKLSREKLSNGQIIWIVENSRGNSKENDILTAGHVKYFRKIGEEIMQFQTVVAMDSRIYAYQNMSQLERFRKEYLTMECKCNLFVSYSEDSPEHVAKVKTIVERLRQENFNVYFYEDEPFGTDIIQFMRHAETSDITLIIGTPEYKRKAYEVNESGVSFEDRIIAGDFMSKNRNKIVPIAFGKFEECIPAPFDKLKGMAIFELTPQEIDKLVCGLINRFMKSRK